MQYDSRDALSSAAQTDPGANASGADRLSELVDELRALIKDARQYLVARLNSARVRLRSAMVTALSGVLICVLVVVGTVTLLLKLIWGAAGALTALAGGRVWVGDLGVSVIGFALIGAAAIYVRRVANARWVRRRTLEDRRRRRASRTSAQPRGERQCNHVRPGI